MIQLFESVKSAMERGENVVLCSILASSGSAPRGAGAKMAVFQDGQTLGTIGGGAVERIAARQATELFQTGASYCQAFCLAPNQVNDIGMICGGSVTVYFRFFDHENARDLELIKTILELLASGQDAWLVSRMEDGKITAMGTFDEAHGLRYCTFPKGQTGVYSIGGGYYYFSYEKKAEHDGEKYFSSDVKLCRFTGEGDTLFEVIE